MKANLATIIERVRSYHPKPDVDLIKRAYVFAGEAHKDQVRKSGEPYMVHPIEVALLITELRLDEASICAALLHDVVEDTPTTKEDLAEMFGEEIASLVDGVTKLSKVRFTSREDVQAESFRKMLLAMTRDIRVILLKLADRLHNMRTLQHMKPSSQVRIARETMEIYAPLANRLGIYWIKAELEDLSFKYLYPEAYASLAKKVAKTRRDRERYIEQIVKIINDLLKKEGIKAEVTGRPKHFWSIYQKMRDKNLEYEEVYDRIAFRIIVDDLPTCYECLGFIHAKWQPVNGRIKDYIATPKPNNYQSLHTTVIGPSGELIEIQIRTRQMHEVAEKGVSAHWLYKERGRALKPKDEQKFSWLRQIVEWQQELPDPTEFIESVKMDLFSDEVFVYTPKGDVKVLTAGSTPVDFAYAIHTEVGHRCMGAKVNGVMVPLRYQLQNGDVVEIITSPKQQPSKDWLEFVRTSRARTKIRSVIRKQQRDRSRQIGRELLERELRKAGLNLNKLIKNGELDRVAAESKCNTIDELFIQLGYGKLVAKKLVERLKPESTGEGQEQVKPESTFAKFMKKLGRNQSTGIGVQGMDDVLVRFARCCNPVPGDPIVGYITRGRGITVHRKNCRQALDLDPERRIDVYWEGNQSQPRPVDIRVYTVDLPGILADLSKCISDAGVNISRVNCRVLENKKAINSFELMVKDRTQLDRVLRSVEKLDGVISVERVSTY